MAVTDLIAVWGAPVAGAANSNRLAGRRYVTVIVRLLIDQRGQLVHGEVLDVEGRIQARFVKWGSLARAMRSWLASQDCGGTPEPDEPDPVQDESRLCKFSPWLLARQEIAAVA